MGSSISVQNPSSCHVAQRRLRSACGRFHNAKLPDSRVSWINALDADGEEVFYLDSDNDEDFADEEPVYPADFRPGGTVYGIRVESEVHFEYTDGEEVKEKTVPVAVVKFERYMKKRSPDNPKFRGQVFDMRVGSVELNGEKSN